MPFEAVRFIHAGNLFVDHQLHATGPLPDEMRSIVEEATVEARSAQRPVLNISGSSFEHDRVAHLPGQIGDRRDDRRDWWRVPHTDRAGGIIRRPRRIGDPEPSCEGARFRIDVGGGRTRRIEGAVTVEVPLVGEWIAVGVTGTRGVEADGEGWGPAGDIRADHRGRGLIGTGELEAV